MAKAVDEKLATLGFFPWGFGSDGIWYMRHCDRAERWEGDGFMRFQTWDEVEHPIYCVIDTDYVKFIQFIEALPKVLHETILANIELSINVVYGNT